MRRLLSRALVVIGGAAAVTAAAWVVSSATASAEPLAHQSSASVTGHVANQSPETASADAGVHDLVSTIATATPAALPVKNVSTSDQLTAVTGQAPNSADLEKLRRQVDAAFEATRQRLEDAPKNLVTSSLDVLQHVTQLPVSKLSQLGLPVSDLLGLSRAVPTNRSMASVAEHSSAAPAIGTVGVKGSDRGHLAGIAYDHSVSSTRSSGESGLSSSTPSMPAPAGVPSAPCCAGNGGSGFSGGSPCAGHLSFGDILGNSAFLARTSSSRSAVFELGKQPGVKPD